MEGYPRGGLKVCVKEVLYAVPVVKQFLGVHTLLDPPEITCAVGILYCGMLHQIHIID